MICYLLNEMLFNKTRNMSVFSTCGVQRPLRLLNRRLGVLKKLSDQDNNDVNEWRALFN